MRRLSFILVILFGVIVWSNLLPYQNYVAAQTMVAQAESVIPASIQAPMADPLPGECIGVTPPGEPETPCCISGYVFIDGQIVAGAEIQISNAQGDQITMFTQVYSTSNALAHYRLNLNAEPLNVTIGDTITITARYSSHTKTMPYLVQSGGQHVDVVLNRNYADDYVYERQIWGQAESGKFNRPSDIALHQGKVYVVDSEN